MYHSLAGRDQISPRQLLGFKGSSEDPALTKKKRKSQVEKVPPVQFYSQGANDVRAPKHKKHRKQVDLTPTSSLPGPRSKGNSRRSSPVLTTTDNNRFREDLSRASSLPNLNGGVHPFTSQSRSTSSRPVSPSHENVELSPAGSNVPHELNNESGTSMPRRFVKRGITRMLKAMGRLPVKKLLPVVLVVENEFVGENAYELILSLGVWSRQRENFPLSIRLFKDMPEENIARVSQMARDHYTLDPDDEFAEKVLRKHMNTAYKNYRSSLSRHFRLKCKRDLQIALANPPENCENLEDWSDMCEYFSKPEVQVRSQRASDARNKQALNHTNEDSETEDEGQQLEDEDGEEETEDVETENEEENMEDGQYENNEGEEVEQYI